MFSKLLYCTATLETHHLIVVHLILASLISALLFVSFVSTFLASIPPFNFGT
jgi:hypothetical protein